MCSMTRIIGGLVVAACAVGAAAQDVCPGHDTFVRDCYPYGYASFGISVAIIDSTAFIARRVSWPCSQGEGGIVIAYDRLDGRWTETARLCAEDGEELDAFGYSIAADGNILVVGAPNDTNYRGIHAGSAYVFEKVGTSWRFVDKLLAFDGQADDGFGHSVAIHGDTIIIGAQDYSRSDAGAAYVFERVGHDWVETAKLTADDGAADIDFGTAVATYCDTAIIGAPRDDNHGSELGSAYVFKRIAGDWVQTDIITPPTGHQARAFGYSLAIDENTIIIGAPGSGTPGCAYIFEHDGGTWIPTATLAASDGHDGDSFGRSVAIDGLIAVVGSPNGGTIYDSGGSAYAFRMKAGEWTQTAILVPSSTTRLAVLEEYGHAVAVSGDTVVVGDPEADANHVDTGAGWVFTDLEFVHCCADIDRNGVLDSMDFFLFLDFFATRDDRADFTDDGVIDGGDFFVYLDAFAAGCP